MDSGTKRGTYCPQLLLCVLLDVCGKVPVDLQIAPYSSSERDHLLAMLPRLQPGDVLVLDQGYPSHEILQELTKAKIDFLIRVPSESTFKAIDDFRESGGKDYLVLVSPPAKCPKDWQPLTLRAVRLTNRDGEESFFLTTLRRSQLSRAQIRDLYHRRWEAEEFYKLFKGPYIGQGQFRSKTPGGVRQEIHVLHLFLGITRFLMAMAARTTGNQFTDLSPKAAVLGAAAYVTRLFLTQAEDRALGVLQALLLRIVRTRDKRRPNRSFPRRSFRPFPRGGPRGRRGA
jgi:hypothetical protein